MVAAGRFVGAAVLDAAQPCAAGVHIDLPTMTYPHHYLEGIELFNNGQFWHAHEAWEAAWLAADDEQAKLFYKGIIQTAAALVHWQKGNPKGLHLNWAKARGKLAQLPAEVMGLGLRQLIAYMDYFDKVEGNGPEPPRLILVR